MTNLWRTTWSVGLALPLVMVATASGQTRMPSSTTSLCETADRTQATYVDGRYTATGWYGGLPSSITVTVTLQGNVIRAVQVTPHATDPTSLDLQRRFAAAVPKVVVGRPIECVKVGKLAGSSGTPAGFNAAIEQIRQDALRK